MTEISNYNLYLMLGQSSSDEADMHYQKIHSLQSYDDVLDYINKHFGDVDDKENIHLGNKKIKIFIDTNKIRYMICKPDSTNVLAIYKTT